MRILPIFSRANHSTPTTMGQAFQKVNCRKPRAMEQNDVFIRMAEASMANTARGKQMESELKSMGLI